MALSRTLSSASASTILASQIHLLALVCCLARASRCHYHLCLQATLLCSRFCPHL
jgi:hypothetical protein